MIFNLNLSQISMSNCTEKQCQLIVEMYHSLRHFDIVFQCNLTFFWKNSCIELRFNLTSFFVGFSYWFSILFSQFLFQYFELTFENIMTVMIYIFQKFIWIFLQLNLSVRRRTVHRGYFKYKTFTFESLISFLSHLYIRIHGM